MADLQLKKGGILYCKVHDPASGEFVDERIEDEEIIFYSNDYICLENGITLKDIFLFIQKYEIFFLPISGCPFITDFVEEAIGSSIDMPDLKEMGSIRFRWIAFVDEEKQLIEHFEMYGSGLEQDYAIDTIPINKINMFPVILDTKYIVRDLISDNILFETNKPFTLSELVRGIIGEISQFGPPEARENFIKAISEEQEPLNLEDMRQKIIENTKKNAQSCSVCSKPINEHSFGKPPGICSSCFEKKGRN